MKKRSKYAPAEGCRYDGIYKVVEYWPEHGRYGFRVWRFRFRRDDPAPAPWTKAGKEIIAQKGYECIFPDGYAEAQAAKAKKAAGERGVAGNGKKWGKGSIVALHQGRERSEASFCLHDTLPPLKPNQNVSSCFITRT